jgi:hypothetical protein
MEDIKVLKTYKLRPKWIKACKNLDKISREIDKLNAKLVHERTKMWGEIEEDINEKGNLSWNEEKGVIELTDKPINCGCEGCQLRAKINLMMEKKDEEKDKPTTC